MALIRPAVINPRPGIIAPVLGGFAGTLLLTSGMFLAPRVGFPVLDVPHLIGGIVTTNLTAAFWLGFWAHFLAGSLAFPVLFGL
ncbi:MAG TPA: hypothetical protein VE714_06965, partial [Gemmatimonadales bacterium]|nr:hypothetical protein [Gemmatimonadales bacterium]